MPQCSHIVDLHNKATSGRESMQSRVSACTDWELAVGSPPFMKNPVRSPAWKQISGKVSCEVYGAGSYRVLQVGCQLQNANAELSGQLKTTIE